MGTLLSLLLKPFLALIFLGGPYALAWWIWHRMPDSKLRRFLFKSWGEDRGPWVSAAREREGSGGGLRVRGRGRSAPTDDGRGT